MKKEIDTMLARYFGGNASEQEMQALEQWISSSVENQQYFDQLTKLYAILGGSEISMPKPNTKRAKESFVAYMAMSTHSQPAAPIAFINKPFYRQWMFQAACIAVIIALSVTTWFIHTSKSDVFLATNTAVKEEVLPDQTQVKLSKNSKITYSSDYGKKNRKIQLEGEATFRVGHQGKGALQILADKILIEDIGTVFAVSAYPDSSNIVVKVREGQVRLFSESDKGIKLKANETGIYNKQTETFRTIASPLSNTTSIESSVPPVHNRHFQFNAMPLRDAVGMISKEYGIVIKFENPGISKRKITVDFEEENPDMILQVIAKTMNLKVTKITDGYLLIN